MILDLGQDMHVHSQFSDGVHSLEQNIAQAESMGLRRLGCVDHVRRETDWLPTFTRSVKDLRRRSTIELSVGIEAKILDASGTLDLPSDIAGVDFIYAADHQFPLADKCHPPHFIRTLVANGETSADELIEGLVRTIQATIRRYPNVIIAHMFSVLPKLHLSESQVRDSLLKELAETAAHYGAIVEVDERWRCPSLRTVEAMVAAGVQLVASSDSHKSDGIGQYEYVRRIANALGSEA